MTARKLTFLLLAAAMLGVLTGYLGTWVTYQNELLWGASHPNHASTFLAYPSLPGSLIAQWMTPGDWQLTEAWQHRHLIASVNGFFWMGVSGMISLLRFIRLPRRDARSIPAAL